MSDRMFLHISLLELPYIVTVLQQTAGGHSSAHCVLCACHGQRGSVDLCVYGSVPYLYIAHDDTPLICLYVCVLPCWWISLCCHYLQVSEKQIPNAKSAAFETEPPMSFKV